MEKNNKIIIKRLNAIGSQIGYPFYFYADGTYGTESLNAVVTVSAPLGKSPVAPAKCAASSVAELYAPVWTDAAVLDYLWPDGSISADKKQDAQATGIIGWINPDKTAPVGQRALCFPCDGWKYENFLTIDENGGCMIFLRNDINSESGRENTRRLLELNDISEAAFPVAEYCNRLKTGSLCKEDLFLPSKQEMRLVSPVFTELAGRITELKYGNSEKIRTRRFGTNAGMLKYCVFTSDLLRPGKICCYLHYPSHTSGTFILKDLSDCACIAPAFWI